MVVVFGFSVRPWALQKLGWEWRYPPSIINRHGSRSRSKSIGERTIRAQVPTYPGVTRSQIRVVSILRVFHFLLNLTRIYSQFTLFRISIRFRKKLCSRRI